jgi:hypothetical protein
VTGIVEIYLVNYTSMDILYAFYLEGEKKLFGKDYDVLFSGNKIHIDTIDRDELLKWYNVRVHTGTIAITKLNT